MKDQTVLVCRRCADADPPVQSVVDRCSKCGHAVWRALSSPPTDAVICLVCADIKEGDTIEPLTVEQQAEIKRYFTLED